MIDKKASVKHGKNYSHPLLSPSSRIKKKTEEGKGCAYSREGANLSVCVWLWKNSSSHLTYKKIRRRFASVSPRGPCMVQEITYKLATFVVISYLSLLYLHLVLVYSYQAII